MTLFIWLLIVLALIIGLFLYHKYGSITFVAHAKLLFKAWSIWLASCGAAIGAFFQSFPDAALQAWMVLPPDIKSVLPPNILSFISPTLVVMALLAQFVRQPKLKDKRDQMEGRP